MNINLLKTSIYLCMHTINVVLLMLFLTHNLFSQKINSNGWDQFTDVLELENDKSEGAFFLVKAKNAFSKNALKKGDSICRVLDTNNFILKSTKEAIVNYRGIKYVKANNTWKMASSHVVDNLNQFFLIKTNNTLLLKKVLAQIGATNISSNQYSVIAKTEWSNIKEYILPLDYVTYVGGECIKPIKESIINDLDFSINGIFKTLQDYPSLSQSSQIIGVKDNLPNANDVDLLNKVENSTIASTMIDSHATDMSTIIAGKGNSGVKGVGVLSEASIFPMNFNNLFPDDSVILDNANVSLVNNSYGTVIENYYGILAEAYDQFTNDNPNVLHIFSSGNSGTNTSESGPYQGIPNYANLTGNFKMAKNFITVGAHDQNYNVLSFSSKGPAYDGRIKPELVAHSIIGTSNATALVSGVAGVLQNAYVENEGELPPSSLVKASLLNGADDIGRPGVDFESGYGSLNAVESLKIIKDQNYIIDAIESNQSKNYQISISENAIDLKVMLVWTDPPAIVNDNLALKNNLDITVNGNGTDFFPSILNTTPSIEAITAEATTGIDNLNPVEQVVISAPEAGNYTINVKSDDLTTDNQFFSLVYTWKTKNLLEWQYPIGGANFPYNGGSTGYIRWKPSFEENKQAKLEISFNDLDVWETISEAVDLSLGFYEWEFPESLHSKARLRFVIDNENQVSEEFLVSNGISMSTSLNCEDNTEIVWTKKENVSQYNIYNLQDAEMKLVETTADTSFVFSKTEYPSPYFAVAPLLDDNIETLRSETVNTTAFPESCYFNFVFASLINSNVNIQVSLSSMYNIKSIEGFRINDDQSLSQISFVDELSMFVFNVMDTKPNEGENTYLFKVTTNDNETYFSRETSVRYFSEQNPFLVFPIPTTKERGISVFSGLSQNEVAFFQMYDLSGKLVLEKIITSDIALIALDDNDISEGLYVYTISGSTIKTEFAKKIIIN